MSKSRSWLCKDGGGCLEELFDAPEPGFVIVDDGPKAIVAFSNDSHRRFDLLDHHGEMSARRLAFFANCGFLASSRRMRFAA